MVTRHGDRSPMYTLPNHVNPHLSCSFPHGSSSSKFPAPRRQRDLADAGNVPDIGDRSTSNVIRRFVAAMQSVTDSSLVSSRLFHRFGLYPNNSICYGAQLTAAGAMQMFWLGRFLNTRYPSLAGTSPTNSDDDEEEELDAGSDPLPPRVYIRSTEYPRTFQSAAALIYGFAGRRALTTASFETTKNIYFCSASTGGNQVCGCPAAARMMAAINKNRTYNVDERKLRSEIARVFNVSSKRLPWMSAMMEVCMTGRRKRSREMIVD